MNCIVYFYKDSILRKKYEIDKYNKIISTRNSQIWKLCNLYFDRVYKYDKSGGKLKLSIKEPINMSGVYDRYSSKLDFLKLQHEITLVLYCGNCDEMYDDFDRAYELRHYTHYYKYTDSENLLPLVEELQNLSSQYEISGLAKASIVVLDLDDTLVDESLRPLSDKLYTHLRELKRIFDYVVLWSHGTSAHVHDALNAVKIPNEFFDLIITRPTLHSCGNNKGLGFVFSELYKRYQVCKITFSCLIDDSPANWTEDYMLFIHVPRHSVRDLTEFYDTNIKKIRGIKYEYDMYGYSAIRQLPK